MDLLPMILAPLGFLLSLCAIAMAFEAKRDIRDLTKKHKE